MMLTHIIGESLSEPHLGPYSCCAVMIDIYIYYRTTVIPYVLVRSLFYVIF